MLDSFLTFINQHCPDLIRQRCLLAVSGGIDSIVLAKLFYEMRIESVIAHCNFQLRTSESNEDEAFVEALAAQYGFPFLSKKFDVKKIEDDRGVSTQMAARDLRYAWFEQMRFELNLNWIVTAHHQDDSFETTILNLTRGTGIAGLRGIAPINGNILRPLSLTSRAQIQEYTMQEQLHWREDSSNASDHYHRNLIRHRVVPALRNINPSVTATFQYTSERLRAADRLLNAMLTTWKDSVVTKSGKHFLISIDGLTAESDCVYRLWFILKDFGFGYRQTNEIMNRLTGDSGKIFHSSSHELLLDRVFLVLREKVKTVGDDAVIWTQEMEFVAAGRLTFSLKKQTDSPGNAVFADKMTACISWDKLIFPLKIRKWEQGDHFQPYGMKGKNKKVSDLLIDLKMSRFAKEDVQVLINGNNEIIWIVGIRTDERYRIYDETVYTGIVTAALISTNF